LPDHQEFVTKIRVTSQDILHFWFTDLTPEQWFMGGDDLDADIRQRFASVHKQAAAGALSEWRKTPEGRLAEVIVLDQFSRNMFRNTPEAFAYDALALTLAQEAVKVGDDQKLSLTQRSFLYMPYMHSESKDVHEVAVKLFNVKGLEGNLAYEYKHKVIIDRFGRYPHRNRILGRVSTLEEIEFLKGPDSSF